MKNNESFPPDIDPAICDPRQTGPLINWQQVERVLIVKLRSIGDTVLSTPSLFALRRFLPSAQIDVLLESWVAPLLDGFSDVDNILRLQPGMPARMAMAWKIRRKRYDVAFNLHGGTTATFFTAASRAPARVGFKYYQYPLFYTHRFPSGESFWRTGQIHSAEQQLALLGFTGVPVTDRPPSKLALTAEAIESMNGRMAASVAAGKPYALMHPAAAFATKQWSAEKFALTVEYLDKKGFGTVAIASNEERGVLDQIRQKSPGSLVTFSDLTLPEITALASQAELFVGNDSGIAHIAAAVNTPVVVIFGSSSIDNWRPWTSSPNEVVRESFPCQPCPGYVCKEFGDPRCILEIKEDKVFAAIDRVLSFK